MDFKRLRDSGVRIARIADRMDVSARITENGSPLVCLDAGSIPVVAFAPLEIPVLIAALEAALGCAVEASRKLKENP